MHNQTVCISAFTQKVEDNETKSKTRIDSKYKREKIAAGLILTSSQYQVPL